MVSIRIKCDNQRVIWLKTDLEGDGIIIAKALYTTANLSILTVHVFKGDKCLWANGRGMQPPYSRG